MAAILLRHRVRRVVATTARSVLPARAMRDLRTLRDWTRLERNRRRLLRRGRPGRLRPSHLAIEGTNVCNAHCVFCGYRTMRRKKAVLPMDLFRRVVDEHVALGGTQIGLTPVVGDPFVDPLVLDRLDYIASRPEIRLCHLFTNGIALGPEIADRILGHGAKLAVNVSLGGLDAETYARTVGVDRFETVVGNLEHLIARKEELGSGLALTISVRVPDEGLAGPFLDALLDHRRAGRLELTRITEYDGWAGAIGPQVLEEAGLGVRVPPERRGACYWLLDAPVVLVDGRVNACACRDVEAELPIGDLRREPLAGVLSGAALREILRRQERGDFPDVCRRCTLYSPIRLGWLLARNYPNEEGVPLDGREPAGRA